MTKPETADEGFDSSVWSSAFTYDEVVALVKRKKALWLKRLHQVDSDSRDDFQTLLGYVLACDYIIQDLASLSAKKQRKRYRCHFCLGWIENGKQHVCGYK